MLPHTNIFYFNLIALDGIEPKLEIEKGEGNEPNIYLDIY